MLAALAAAIVVDAPQQNAIALGSRLLHLLMTMASAATNITPTAPDLLTSLTALAVAVYRERQHPDYLDADSFWPGPVGIDDAVLRDASRFSLVVRDRHPLFAATAKTLFAADEFESIADGEGLSAPFVMHPGGGSRMSASLMLLGVLAGALQQVYFFRLPRDESSFVRLVLDGFEELRRAIKGEQVRAYVVQGVAGVTLPEGRQVLTPWGTLRPAPPEVLRRHFSVDFRPVTSCILSETRLLPVKFDRAAEPKGDFDHTQVATERGRSLFPLSCALAADGAGAGVPVMTWSTLLLPFQLGFSYTYSALPPRAKPAVDLSERIGSIEEWARIVEAAHTPTADIAARRLISAGGHRIDPGDALIDSVTVWETLVGTNTETTFRVTASLAKLLEQDHTKRRALRKSLGEIYNVRSLVVHGSPVDESSVAKAAAEAFGIAVRALAISYKRGRLWLSLSSRERGDTILLEEP